MVQTLVIDPSILIQAFITDIHTARVETVLSQLVEPQEIILHTLEFCLIGCTNILWKWIRFHGLSSTTAQQSKRYLTSLPLKIYPVIFLLPRALTIGVDYALAVYDSLYLALSEILSVPLITVDERQANAAVKLGLPVKLITDFPEWQS